MMQAIVTKNLSKVFFQRKGLFRKQKIFAVNSVNLTVESGEVFGLLGPNGAGKTTLIKMLVGLLTPSSGEAVINGGNINLIYATERSFYSRLTARQNLEFFAALNNLTFSRSKNRINELLEFFGLQDKANVWFEEYSSGMKQRLAIARGLLNDPEIIFMDEPTKGLDPMEAHKLREFIRGPLVRDKKKTVFLATHQLDEAKELCDNIAIMHLGQIRLCGNTQGLTDSKNRTLYELFCDAVKG